MKRYFYLLTLAMLTFSVCRAQIKKGQVLLSGVIQFSDNKSKLPAPDFDKAYGTTLAPSIGWAIRDNLEFGGRFLYAHSKTDTYIEYRQQVPPYIYKHYDEFTNYGFAVYIRRYKDLGHGFAFFAEGSVIGISGSRKEEMDTVPGLNIDQKSWSVSASFTGGMVYRVARRWMFEVGFVRLINAGYTHVTDKGEDANSNYNPSKSDQFAIGTNLSQALSSFSFGCKYILN